MMPLMIAVLILNDALNQVGITKRIATWFITRKAVKNRPWVFIGMFILAGIVLEMFMELIPPIIIMLAICDSICSDLGYERDDSFPKALRMGILWTSVVAYGSSPIAHSIVVIILNNIEKATGIAISYLQYLGVGIPFVLLFFGATMLVLKFIVRPDVSKFVHYDLEKVQGETKPLGLRGKLVVAIFALVVFLWIFPNFGGYISFLAPVANSLRALPARFPPSPDDWHCASQPHSCGRKAAHQLQRIAQQDQLVRNPVYRMHRVAGILLHQREHRDYAVPPEYVRPAEQHAFALWNRRGRSGHLPRADELHVEPSVVPVGIRRVPAGA
jgi:Na+/H+ antiporter NhaD/arsenite permease-like protein